MALVVDTYEDAEGEMITLGENGAIADLGTQLSFGAKHRPYALKIFLRQAGTKRMSSVMITPIFTGERRRSSETSEEQSRPISGRDVVLPSKSFTSNIGGPSMRRRDSKSLLHADDDGQGRRGSTGEPFQRRPSAADMHVRHSSAGLGDSQRRGSVDSDGDLLDEVSEIGAPWEPAFDRRPQGVDALDWMMSQDLEHPPRGPARGGGVGMHVEIPMNQLHANAMMRGSIASIESGNLDTPSSASSALKTPTRVSPMISPFNPDSRFPVPNARGPLDLPSPVGGSHSVVIVPARHADEPDYEYHLQKSISSNGSSHSDLPSFHQQPFPQQPGAPPSQFGAPPLRFNPAVPPSPTLWRGQPYGLADSADIERELLEGRRDTEESSSEEIEVVDSDRRGTQYAFVPVSSPSPASASASAANAKNAVPNRPHSSSSPNAGNRGTETSKRTVSESGGGSGSSGNGAVPSQNGLGASQERVQSPKPHDLRQPMNKSGNRSRAERTSSTSSLKPLSLAWKKGDLIGRGGFGSVYKGLLSNGQFVAVKVLELPPDVDPTKSNTYVSFMKEIDMLKALEHPNIVRYIGSTVEASTINVFLEYVPGGSIASMISKYGPFDEPMIKLFSKHILQALSYLHRNNIAHRDIKGANILVDTQGVAKLADFGCSKSVSLKSGGVGENFQTMLGTPYWMAPEVMRQEGHGRNADIWSFGCTLVEMASGKPPWAKEYTQIFALLYEVGTSTKIPDIPEHLSPELKDLLLQCFKRAPMERPTAEQLLRHPWFHDEYDDGEDELDDFVEVSSVSQNLGGFPSSKKRSGNLLTKSMSASRSQALQEQPKSLEALPELVLVRMFQFMSPQMVVAMAHTCAHLRFLAQRNAVWVALATNRWPKLRINLDALSTTNPSSANNRSGAFSEDVGEVDFGKKLFMASLKYDRRFAVDPMYRHVRSVKGHTKRVHAMQLLEGLAKLITCAGDKKIKIWDIGTPSSSSSSAGSLPSPSSSSSGSASPSITLAGSGSISKDAASSPSSASKKKKASVTLRGHNAAVTCFHASNSMLVSGSSDGMIKVWDMKSKKSTMSVRTGDAGLTGLQFDEKFNYLITSSNDGVAKVWDLQTLNVRLTLTGHKAAINAIKFHGHTLATASSDKRVKIWDLRTGTLLKTLHGHKDEIHCLDIVGDTVIAGAADGSLLEWAFLDRNASGPRSYPLPANINPSPILSVHFDGVNTVIAGREDGLVLIYQYHAGTLHSSFKADSGAITALTACNQVLATAGYGEKIVKLWALVNP